ncbi:MAG: hypothetical protein Q7U04_17390, partial [Bacteriovorax sp.]|nr:hypothetical protein [Bacteriovorax sp.]
KSVNVDLGSAHGEYKMVSLILKNGSTIEYSKNDFEAGSLLLGSVGNKLKITSLQYANSVSHSESEDKLVKGYEISK